MKILISHLLFLSTKVHTMRIARRKGRMWTLFSSYRPLKEIKWWLQLSISRVWASRTATRAPTGTGTRCSDLTFWMAGTRRYKVKDKIFSYNHSIQLLIIHFEDFFFCFFIERFIDITELDIKLHFASIINAWTQLDHSFSYLQ